MGEQGCGLNLAFHIDVWVVGRGEVCCGRLVVSEAAWELGSSVAVNLFGTLNYGGEMGDQLIAFVISYYVYFFSDRLCLF